MIEQIEFPLQPKSRGIHLVTTEILRHLPELPQAGVAKSTNQAYFGGIGVE